MKNNKKKESYIIQETCAALRKILEIRPFTPPYSTSPNILSVFIAEKEIGVALVRGDGTLVDHMEIAITNIPLEENENCFSLELEGGRKKVIEKIVEFSSKTLCYRDLIAISANHLSAPELRTLLRLAFPDIPQSMMANPMVSWKFANSAR